MSWETKNRSFVVPVTPAVTALIRQERPESIRLSRDSVRLFCGSVPVCSDRSNGCFRGGMPAAAGWKAAAVLPFAPVLCTGTVPAKKFSTKAKSFLDKKVRPI